MYNSNATWSFITTTESNTNFIGYISYQVEGDTSLNHYFVNTMRSRLNGRHIPDDIFKMIFVNENVWISINISLKFVLRGPVNNISTLVHAMAWRRPGGEPLSEPMMVRLPTHICVTRPQWDKMNLKHERPRYKGTVCDGHADVICITVLQMLAT